MSGVRLPRGWAAPAAVALLAMLAVAAVGLLAPARADAHAVVVDTEPRRSAALERPPDRVAIRFDEPIESRFGALRVFDVDGDEVQVGGIERPSGEEIAVGLVADLPDGAYTVTYRVVSADSHPIAGGFTFTVGDAGGGAAAEVAELLGDHSAGPVTDAAFGAVRVVSYAAIALVAGGALFLALVAAPALRAGGAAAGPAAPALRARATPVLVGAALVGVAASVLGLVAQGATAAGTTVWAALDPALLGDVIDTRFGEVWALRALAFAAAAVLLWRLGATGGWPARRAGGAWRAIALGGALAALVVSPALAGHAGAASDSRWLVPLDTLHVAAMSAWVGGIALIVLALPAATRALAGGERARLLADLLGRFSAVALVAVAALALTGTLQALLYLDSLDALWTTAFGRAILAKSALFALLIGFGAHHRRRSLPRLRALGARGALPGATGIALRRGLRGELVLFAAVLAATAALVSYAPGTLAAGPYGTSVDLGAAQLELTVDPATAGDNELHAYLFDSASGARYDRARELVLTASQDELDIGPIELTVRRAGPGHFVAARAPLAPAGEWTFAARARISDFEELRGEAEVPIR